MLGSERRAVLGDNFETGLAGNKKNETSGFALWLSFAEPTVAQ
jgi:hypothetical protein